LSGWFDRRIAAIIEHLPADLPKTLALEEQARFAIGYYHEKAQRFARGAEDAAETPEGDEE